MKQNDLSNHPYFTRGLLVRSGKDLFIQHGKYARDLDIGLYPVWVYPEVVRQLPSDADAAYFFSYVVNLLHNVHRHERQDLAAEPRDLVFTLDCTKLAFKTGLQRVDLQMTLGDINDLDQVSVRPGRLLVYSDLVFREKPKDSWPMQIYPTDTRIYSDDAMTFGNARRAFLMDKILYSFTLDKNGVPKTRWMKDIDGKRHWQVTKENLAEFTGLQVEEVSRCLDTLEYNEFISLREAEQRGKYTNLFIRPNLKLWLKRARMALRQFVERQEILATPPAHLLNRGPDYPPVRPFLDARDRLHWR